MQDLQTIINDASECGSAELREVGRLIRSSHSLASALRSILGTAFIWTEALANTEFESKSQLAREQGRIQGLRDGLLGLLSDIESAEATSTSEAEELNDFNAE